MTTLQALQAVNHYPVPAETLSAIAVEHSLNINAEATQQVLDSAQYKKSVADILMWLSFAPDISQGGQSYSFTDEQRAWFRARSKSILAEIDDNSNNLPYGYKGEFL